MRPLSVLSGRLRKLSIRQNVLPAYRPPGGIRKVVFEGGLGSQLLPFLEKSYLTSLGIPFTVEAGYFDNNTKIRRSRGLVDHWSFRLDYYGHTLQSLMDGAIPNAPELQVSESRNHDLWNSDFWSYARKSGPSLFPINSLLLQEFMRSIDLDVQQSYSVIHVRRGDYVRAASLLVVDSMWLKVLERVKSLTTEILVITSDSKIPKDTKREVNRIFNTKRIRIIYLEGAEVDECILHDFMRSSSLLVASNSNFSFTAAVLSGSETFSIIPSVFHGDKDLEEINRGFRSAGDFFILK